MTDTLHDFAVEVTCEPSLNNLMDSLSHDFSSVVFYIIPPTFDKQAT